MLQSFELTGKSRSELNTELRFIFAGARVDREELVRLEIPHSKDSERISGCVIKILRTLRKEECVQFYVNEDGFASGTTESIFLLNKYGQDILSGVKEQNFVLVKV